MSPQSSEERVNCHPIFLHSYIIHSFSRHTRKQMGKDSHYYITFKDGIETWKTKVKMAKKKNNRERKIIIILWLHMPLGRHSAVPWLFCAVFHVEFFVVF